MQKSKLMVGLAATVVGFAALVFASSAAFAYANSVTYSGQGITADGSGGYVFDTEICGTENGAPVDGAYIFWVLTATKASNADISGPWGTAAMTKKGNGAFQFVSDFYDLGSLIGVVTATYDGNATNAQLVISHGCPGETPPS